MPARVRLLRFGSGSAWVSALEAAAAEARGAPWSWVREERRRRPSIWPGGGGERRDRAEEDSIFVLAASEAAG